MHSLLTFFKILLLQILAQILVGIQIVLSCVASAIVLSATGDIISHDACLGYFEHHYGKSGGNKICNQGGFVLKMLCSLTALGHMVISYNIPETLLLYFCYKAIKEQTESVRKAIGQESYKNRKR